MARKSTNTDEIKVFAYYGADDRLKRIALDRLLAGLIDPDFQDFDLEIITGGDLTANRLMQSSSQAPFASKRRVVVITEADDIPLAEQHTIAEKLDKLPDSACVVFVTPSPELQDGKPKKGSELNADLMKVIKKIGQAIDFPLLRDQDAMSMVRDMLKEHGKTISPTAAALLVRRCGTDTGSLSMEVDKLINYTGEDLSVTDADVEDVTTETAEEKIFSLMDAVGSKDAAQALHYLHPLLHNGNNVQGEALRTLTMLSRHFRQLWQVRALLDVGCKTIAPGMIPAQCADILPSDSILKKSDWQLRKIVNQAKNFSMDELTQCFEKIASVDMSIKGIERGVSDAALALELLVVELSTRRQIAKKGR